MRRGDDDLTAAYMAGFHKRDDEIKRLRDAVEWACSKEAMSQSLRLPEGCSRMNGAERITAEICIENLQVGLRRRAEGK